MIGKVLIVEDNMDDVFVIKRGFKKSNIENELIHSKNGKEALDYLETVAYEHIEIILLDLNMEIMNGFEFLNYRMAHPKLKKVPVVILTSSVRDEDIEKAYALGANGYVAKPLDLLDFLETVTKIDEFWIRICRKPKI